MVRQSDYQEAEVQACFSVLLEIMTALGELRENVVIVGGNVPSLLIPSAKEKHPGTLDVDLATKKYRTLKLEKPEGVTLFSIAQ